MTTTNHRYKQCNPLFFKWAIISISCLLISSCSTLKNISDTAATFTIAPEIELDPNLTTPLAGVLTLTTDVPTRITLEISSRKKNWTLELKKFSSSHTIPVLGLRVDTTHKVKIFFSDSQMFFKT